PARQFLLPRAQVQLLAILSHQQYEPILGEKMRIRPAEQLSDRAADTGRDRLAFRIFSPCRARRLPPRGKLPGNGPGSEPPFLRFHPGCDNDFEKRNRQADLVKSRAWAWNRWLDQRTPRNIRI